MKTILRDPPSGHVVSSHRACLRALPLVLALAVATLMPAGAAGPGRDPIADMEPKSVALLTVDSGEFGVGFVIASTSSTTYLLTAAHVLGCAETDQIGCRDTVQVRFVGQLSTLTGTKVLAAKSPDGTDLALVKVGLGNKTPIPIQSQAITDEDLYVLGFSSAIIKASDQFGGLPETHNGNVSRVDPNETLIEVNVPAYPGFSGGPVVDKSTRSIIGVFTGHLRPEEQTSIDYQGVGPARILAFLTAAKAKERFDFQEFSPDEKQQSAPQADAGNESALSVLPTAAKPAGVTIAAAPVPSATTAAQPAAPPAANFLNPAAAPPVQSAIALARQGDPRAEYALSQAYLSGSGVDVDVNTALQWMQKAADAHYPPALTALGLIYAQGQLVARDPNRALTLLQSAAAAGDPLAELNLGNVYHFGKLGTTPDENVSKAWYAKAFASLNAASQQGDADATWRLGNLLVAGTGLDAPNPPQGLALLERASDLGSPKASTNLAGMYLRGYPPVVEKNVATGLVFLRKSEGQGGVDAAALLAQTYLVGAYGQQRDPGLGLRYLQEAAARGKPWAMWRLGKAYLDGELLPKNLELAGAWFRKSAELGELFGQNEYALWLLQNAPPAERNPTQGLAVLRDAADVKHFSRSLRYLGEFYRDGMFVPRDAATAFKYFQAGVNHGGGPVLYYDLGRAYENGEGTMRDPALAKYWYTRSANLKYEPAVAKLAQLGQS